MIVSHVRTGRQWGDKREERTGKASFGNARVEWREFDHWDGPTEAGEAGEYVRSTEIVTHGPMLWPGKP